MNYLSINSIFKEIKWRLLFKKLRKIEFLILDVDGVLTDGGLWYQNNGDILKRFDVKDGLSLNLAQEAGIQIILVSGGESFCTEIRASQLGIKDYFFGVKDKYKNIYLKGAESRIIGGNHFYIDNYYSIIIIDEIKDLLNL